MMNRRHVLAALGAATCSMTATVIARSAAKALRVGVVGGGIVGTSIALHLAQSGADVTLFEKAAPSKGATQNSFGFINIFELDKHYQALRIESFEVYQELDIPLQLGITWGGYINWAHTHAEGDGVRAYAATLDGTPYAVQRLSPGEFHAVSPAVIPGPLDAAFFSPHAGHVDPVWATYRLLDRARSYGARALYPCEVTDILLANDRLVGVMTSKGRFPLDRLVVAAGVDSPQLLGQVGLALPLRHAPGILAHSVPIPELTKIVYDGPGGIEFKQMANGRIVGTDALEPPDIPAHAEIRRRSIDFPDASQRNAHGRRILDRIASVLPGAHAVTLDYLTLGFRPMPIDGFPIVGPTPASKDVYVAVTHSGVTLAPILGRYVSREVLTDMTMPELAPYRPARFAVRRAA